MAPLLPAIAAHARRLVSSAVGNYSSDPLAKLGPLAARAILLGRDGGEGDEIQDPSKVPQLDPSAGVTNPHDINNTFVFIIFGLIGVGFVLTGIWFFFWAKNGGFHFKENDWEDYKSTVLRRKGPNGTLLSNATPSTDLGGGSIYKDMDDTRTAYTGGLTEMTGDTMSTMTGITAGASDIAGRERRRRAREERKRASRKKGRSASGGRGETEDETLRAYRNERSARVGGLNKESEASEWEGSTNPEMSTVAGSEPLLAHRQSTPTRANKHAATGEESYYESASERTRDDKSRPPRSGAKAGGIRKVYSTAARREDRMRTAASSSSSNSNNKTALQRNYSYQRADLRSPTSAINEEHESSSFIGPTERASGGRYLPAPLSRVTESDGGDSDLGTKSYRHHIPGISSAAETESAEARRERRAEREKRKKRNSSRG
ncbi:hypothetical protein GGR50DRAFT_264184 [Xylaria sp. CBS 124048]|nr:hypothetical protein GGR50DRAFT_264184 [Xylaria sp. CBS 124048]